MTQQLHITFQSDQRGIVEAEVEITVTRLGRAWDFQGFRFEDVWATKDDETEWLDFMPEDLVEQAEEEAEREFLKLDL